MVGALSDTGKAISCAGFCSSHGKSDFLRGILLFPHGKSDFLHGILLFLHGKSDFLHGILLFPRRKSDFLRGKFFVIPSSDGMIIETSLCAERILEAVTTIQEATAVLPG